MKSECSVSDFSYVSEPTLVLLRIVVDCQPFASSSRNSSSGNPVT